MPYCRITLSALLFIPFAVSLAGAPRQTGRARIKPVIRQVDHIVVQTNAPQALYDFFTDTLKLPVAWPIAEYPGFTSAGVSVGNVILNLFNSSGRRDNVAPARAEARFRGIALEPYPLHESLPQLQARGITFNPPEPYIAVLPNGSPGTLWTTVVLPQISKPNLSVFLYEYSTAFLNVEVRRKALGGQIVLSKGGLLGIESVKEVVIGTTDLASDRSHWQKLLSPSASPSPGIWQVGSGPAVHLVSSAGEGIRRIVLKVRSLPQARTILEGKDLQGSIAAKEVAINPSRIQGLSIRLVEK